MTGFDLFMKEAKECGLDLTKARLLYENLAKALDPTEERWGRKRVELTNDEAILASFLLAKFGAAVRTTYSTTRSEIVHEYEIELLSCK